MQCQGVGAPLVDNYAGPYFVLEKGPKVVKLQLEERNEVVGRDRLKPHIGQAPPTGSSIGDLKSLYNYYI